MKCKHCENHEGRACGGTVCDVCFKELYTFVQRYKSKTGEEISREEAEKRTFQKDFSGTVYIDTILKRDFDPKFHREFPIVKTGEVK